LALLGFFPAFYPPSSGGEARAAHLWRALAQRFDVTAVTPTFPGASLEAVHHADFLVEHRVPKKQPHIWWHRTLDRLGGFPECSALVVSLAGKRDAEYTRLASEAIEGADVVMMEGPFFPHLLPPKGKLCVYSSYNVEYKLQAQTWRGPWSWPAVAYVKRNERRLVKRSDLVFACSDEDRQHFMNVLGAPPENAFVAPNGTDLSRLPTPAIDETERLTAWHALVARTPVLAQRWRELGRPAEGPGGRPRILFMGSAFPTNIEAAFLIERELAAALPEADFYMAGGCCGRMEGTPPGNVFRLGFLDEGKPIESFLRMGHLTVNPVLRGSGTNVKMLDFFGAGLPALATPTGARGMAPFAEPSHGLSVVDRAGLADTLRHILADRRGLANAGREARRVVEREFQWSEIGGAMCEAILQRMAPQRVLVAVDYPIWPAHHGGKLRIFEQARALASAGFPVTLLTLNKDFANGARAIAPGVVEATISRAPKHHRLDDSVRAKLGGILAPDDLTCLLPTAPLQPYLDAARRLAPKHCAAILSHPYMMRAERELRRTGMLIHDAHNAEAPMKESMLERTGAAGEQKGLRAGLFRLIDEAERHLCAESDLLIATSPEDLATLVERSGRPAEAPSAVAPNGVDCTAIRPATRANRERLKLQAGLPAGSFVSLYIASAHLPNAEAAWFIVGPLAHEVPEGLFLLAGSVCETMDNAKLPANVRLMGRVSDELKAQLLKMADAVLVPVESGSGTNLKLIEAMAAGLPIVATPTGARGTGLADGRELLIAQRTEFPAAIRKLMADPALGERLGSAARAQAELRFDWPVAMAPLIDALRQHLKK